MFLRKTQRKKDGKTHEYWSVVENKRVAGGRVVQRHVLYLGEINSSQAAVWRKAIEVLDEDAGRPRTMALFPEDRCAGVGIRRVGGPASPVGDAAVPAAAMGRLLAGWAVVAGVAAGPLLGRSPAAEPQGHAMGSDPAGVGRVSADRAGQRVEAAPRVVRQQRHGRPAGGDFGLAEAHKLYACHDLLLQHKDALFSHLVARWRDLFNANFDVLLYDLTSTYFEINASDVAEGDKRRHGYSRDKRPDCPQVVIALVVTPDGLPLAYEVLPGNTADCTTLRMFLARIERQYGRARRVWVMDRGIPTEAVLAEMRGSDPPVQYLVGTPKGRLSRLEKQLLAKPWQEARPGVSVKLLAEDDELYVYAESVDRVSKERAMRRRQLKWLWKRLERWPRWKSRARKC